MVSERACEPLAKMRRERMSRYGYILAVDEGDGVGGSENGSRWKMNQQTKGEMKGSGGRTVRSERKDSISCLGCCIMASLQPVFKNVRLHHFLSVAAVACSVCFAETLPNGRVLWEH